MHRRLVQFARSESILAICSFIPTAACVPPPLTHRIRIATEFEELRVEMGDLPLFAPARPELLASET